MCDSWTHDSTGDYYWRLKKQGTASLQTGPEYDQSEHSNDGHYIYLETSGPQLVRGETVRLMSRVIKGVVKDCKVNILMMGYLETSEPQLVQGETVRLMSRVITGGVKDCKVNILMMGITSTWRRQGYILYGERRSG
jgi:hypothetical protein